MSEPREPITWVWRSPQAAVVLKPAGLPTQAPQAYSSLESLLRFQLDDPQAYLAIPHRLDRPVAGLMLIAFTKRAARLLSEQFESRRITKTYLALVAGRYPQASELWTDTLCKIKDRAEVRLLRDSETTTNSPALHSSTTMATQRSDRDSVELEPSKPAITHMQRLAFIEPEQTLLQLSPQTGRMHQLRVQAASRGYPIIGDQLYGSQSLLDPAQQDAIALFASRLQFFDPANGKPVDVTAPLPAWCQHEAR